MRRGAAQRPPRLRQRRHLFRRRPRLQPKSDLDRFLHGEIAGGPGIAMAQTKQADRRRRSTGRCRCSAVSVSCAASASSFASTSRFNRSAAISRARCFQGFDLRRRQSEPAQPVGARLAQRVMVKRIERGADAGPDRRGAGGGQLLAADDRGQAGITGLAPPQRRHACDLEYRLQPRVLLHQRVDGLFEVGLGVEVEQSLPT